MMSEIVDERAFKVRLMRSICGGEWLMEIIGSGPTNSHRRCKQIGNVLLFGEPFIFDGCSTLSKIVDISVERWIRHHQSHPFDWERKGGGGGNNENYYSCSEEPLIVIVRWLFILSPRKRMVRRVALVRSDETDKREEDHVIQSDLSDITVWKNFKVLSISSRLWQGNIRNRKKILRYLVDQQLAASAGTKIRVLELRREIVHHCSFVVLLNLVTLFPWEFHTVWSTIVWRESYDQFFFAAQWTMGFDRLWKSNLRFTKHSTW